MLAGGAAASALARVARRREGNALGVPDGRCPTSHHLRLAFLKLMPDLRFAAYGGFLLFDDAGAVVVVQTVGAAPTFGAPQAWPRVTEQLGGRAFSR